MQELFEALKDDPEPFLLESGQNAAGLGRYSFFGSDPFLVMHSRGETCLLETCDEKKTIRTDALSLLRDLFHKYRITGLRRGVPFLGGAVGFFSYDFGFTLEKIARKNSPLEAVPDVFFAFYDVVVCYDHVRREMTVFSSGFPEKALLRKSRSEQRLKGVLKKLESKGVGSRACGEVRGRQAMEPSITSNFTRNEYLKAVRKVKEYIARGDIYQVNLSQKLSSRLVIDDWELYQRLTAYFPVPFSSFLSAGSSSIISASPERFLSFDGRVVSTRPMKGTRKRTGREVLDRKLKSDLIRSPKEKAELAMIVDLERNDLGRVCDYGSIKVSTLRSIEAYANVFQATAEVEGRLHKSKDRFDLIRACFPGGSVTGCPKIRAMEIIEEVEPDARGVYTGSLGFISFHDTLELNILIRSFLKRGSDISFHVGGGIVTDSKPEDEYEETFVKAQALLDALGEKMK